MEKVTVTNEYIDIDGVKLYPPIEREALEAVLGEPRFEENKEDDKEYGFGWSYWDGQGILAKLSSDGGYYDLITIMIRDGDDRKTSVKGTFGGGIFIGKKPYTQVKMKQGLFCCSLKKGPFEMQTFFAEDIDKLEERYRPLAEMYSYRFTISCDAPRKKTDKFRQIKPEGEVLHFDNFNFKLAVIQCLMYDKELLTPKFDIYEFAEGYTRREIDVDEEGYEPIKEALNWFKKLEIPASLADEVTELCMDGGSDVYLQIIPFWDGEDEYFDLKRVIPEEISQFRNLKKMTVMSENYDEVAKVLKECGVETERL